MRKLKNYTVKEYADALARKEPVPGGGSCAALTGVLGAALISMVANYSKGKSSSKAVEKRIKSICEKSEDLRAQLMECVDLDAAAYLQVVKTRKASASEKKKALKQARGIPLRVCRLCYKAIQLTPYLVVHGNKYLISDIKVAIELLLASFNSA